MKSLVTLNEELDALRSEARAILDNIKCEKLRMDEAEEASYRAACKAIEAKLSDPSVQKQLELLRYRNTCPAFGFDARVSVEMDGPVLTFTHEREGNRAVLTANLETLEFEIH